MSTAWMLVVLVVRRGSSTAVTFRMAAMVSATASWIGVGPTTSPA